MIPALKHNPDKETVNIAANTSGYFSELDALLHGEVETLAGGDEAGPD